MKTIFYNGKVYTGELPLAEAFVVENGMFSYAGDTAGALALAQEEDARVDLEGRFVCAGFNDSHMHLLNYGQSLLSAKLDKPVRDLPHKAVKLSNPSYSSTLGLLDLVISTYDNERANSGVSGFFRSLFGS